MQHNNEFADRTLYPLANSWYVGANIRRNPRVFMPYVDGVAACKKKCDEIALTGYEGFRLPLRDLIWAWHRLQASGGRVAIGALAKELGCSRKHLTLHFSPRIWNLAQAASPHPAL